jgi:hypothetical protein
LQNIERYFQCLSQPGAGEARKGIALWLLPARLVPPLTIDTAFSHDLLTTTVDHISIDGQEVYFVATNTPLRQGVLESDVDVIPLGRIAPEYVGIWLLRLQGLIERGRIESPAAVGLKLRSFLHEVEAIGGPPFGISPAAAATMACG